MVVVTEVAEIEEVPGVFRHEWVNREAFFMTGLEPDEVLDQHVSPEQIKRRIQIATLDAALSTRF